MHLLKLLLEGLPFRIGDNSRRRQRKKHQEDSHGERSWAAEAGSSAVESQKCLSKTQRWVFLSSHKALLFFLTIRKIHIFLYLFPLPQVTWMCFRGLFPVGSPPVARPSQNRAGLSPFWSQDSLLGASAWDELQRRSAFEKAEAKQAKRLKASHSAFWFGTQILNKDKHSKAKPFRFSKFSSLYHLTPQLSKELSTLCSSSEALSKSCGSALDFRSSMSQT